MKEMFWRVLGCWQPAQHGPTKLPLGGLQAPKASAEAAEYSFSNA